MMFRSFEGNCSGDTDACSSSSTPYVSMGCVMFPVFVYVWFHYSRQYCHSQFGGEDGGSFNDSSDFEPAYYKQHSPRYEKNQIITAPSVVDILFRLHRTSPFWWILCGNLQNGFASFFFCFCSHPKKRPPTCFDDMPNGSSFITPETAPKATRPQCSQIGW